MKKLIAIVLSSSLLLGTVAGIGSNKAKAADYGLSNPRVDSEGNVTWDCAYFGSYYQTAQWTKEPIKWRVLSVDENNNAFIVADKNLDCKKYNETYEDVTWETCTLRSWLNGYDASANGNGIDYSADNFIDEAFTEEEQSAINTTMVINNDNPKYGTDGGNDTEDKVYLLSIEEASNTEYGFDNTFNVNSKTREVKNTDYATVNDTITSYRYGIVRNGYAYLRSSGGSSAGVCVVDFYGYADPLGGSVSHGSYGVRPALRINLSSSSVWTDAGVMDSEGNAGVSDNVINNPVVENGVTTWDCIYFGSYYQTAKWTKESIKWRVMSVEGDDAFFVADKNLDCKPYNETYAEVTWETSTIRSWLNGYGASTIGNGIDYLDDNFIDEAFTAEEQAAINTTTVINNENPEYGTDGGNDTEDKVYLLSIEEASNTAYGFDSTYNDESKTREVKNTDYAKTNGAFTGSSLGYSGNGYWWLRSPGGNSDVACYVDNDGCGYNDGRLVSLFDNGVRPALHVNLSSSVWEVAGTVTSNGEVVEPEPSTEPTVSPSATTSPEGTEEPSDGKEPTAEPTQAPEQEGTAAPTTEPNTTPTEQPGTTASPSPQSTLALLGTPAPVQTVAPTDTPKADDKVSKTDEVKTFKLSSLKIKKNDTKITGKVSVSKATIKIKVGSKAWKKATVKGKKFTLKTAKLKKNTKVQIKVSKKGYKTLKKSFKVK